MPRAPSEKKAEAEKLFKKGLKLAEIAKKLDVPEGTVRSWKNRGKWGEKPPRKINATLQKKMKKGMQRCKKRSGADSREIKIQQVTHHPFPKEIRTLKSMGHSPNYILQILMRMSGN
ncbi:MAG: hypothetical protein K1W27_07040 [Lachnospiraceae bacterium]|jgi:transposase|nr:hypothetical protein C804_05814 [Lachnospiraceae bacterium A4]